DKLHELLAQQQRLALQDKKLLEEYKSEINELRALKMVQEDIKDNPLIIDAKRERAHKEEVQKKPKKWRRLWKQGKKRYRSK
ncbi:hypothetical protein MZO24_017395, partial [Enterococcus faecalis]|nr:hypothetical protein [Enterococcus faecalis]